MARKEHIRGSGSGGAGTWLFERLVVAAMLLAVAAFAAFIFLAAVGLVDTEINTPFGVTLGEYLRFDQQPRSLIRLAVGAGSLFIGLMAVVLLMRRGSSGRDAPSGQHILIADAQGMVRVNNQGICAVASAAAARIPGVLEVKVTVVSQDVDPLRLRMTVWVSAAADVSRTGDEARNKATDAVERLVGLEVNQVATDMEVVPLQKMGRMLE